MTAPWGFEVGGPPHDVTLYVEGLPRESPIPIVCRLGNHVKPGLVYLGLTAEAELKMVGQVLDVVVNMFLNDHIKHVMGHAACSLRKHRSRLHISSLHLIAPAKLHFTENSL